MIAITRRITIALGLAALVPAPSQARRRRKRRRKTARLGCGICTPDRNALFVTIANFFEDEDTVSVTLTPASGNPRVLAPEDFATALAASMVHNGAPICRTA